MADRYLKIVLTVIALELFWIGVKDAAPPVSAQQSPTRVVVTGIDIAPSAESRGSLPVTMRASEEALRVIAERPVKVEADRPLKIEADRPIGVSIDRAIRIEADRPVPVQHVPYTPGRIPG